MPYTGVLWITKGKGKSLINRILTVKIIDYLGNNRRRRLSWLNFNFAAAGSATRFEVAKFIFEQLRMPVNLTACKSIDYLTAATRPLNSRFNCGKIQALLNEPIKPWQGPLLMKVTCYFPRPKSHFGTGKNATKLKESAPTWKASRPDFDNLIKFIADALNGVFYKDDSQIVFASVSKRYEIDTEVGVTVRLEELQA